MQISLQAALCKIGVLQLQVDGLNEKVRLKDAQIASLKRKLADGEEDGDKQPE